MQGRLISYRQKKILVVSQMARRAPAVLIMLPIPTIRQEEELRIMATKEKQPAESPADTTTTETTPATKRKASVANADADEIEVDLTAPEPPSKRARRALKKGKVLPKKADSDDDADGKDDKKDKKDKVRSEHGVWVGNLPFTLTQAQLRKWLVDTSGEVITEASITRLKLPTTKERGADKKDKAPANKGFAYVDFTDIGGKVAAIAMSESDLQGRKILIKDSKSFEGRPEKAKEPEEDAEEEEKKEESRKVFVGNMSFKTTEEDLRRNFEKCGEIDWVKVATFEDTGKCKGYGWVKFREAEGAAWAIKGFVKIKEAIETEDDFRESKDSGEDEEPKERQFKTRKWWVNRMLGRELKLELAEDDQIRYKKRFRGGPKIDKDGESKPFQRKPRENGEGGDGRAEPKPLKESTDIQVARLTGAVVKHTGSKMTFE